MALHFNLHIQPCVFTHLQPPRFAPFRAATTSSCKTRCMTSSVTSPPTQTIVRRTANYHPNIWDFDFIQSLTSDYTGDKYVTEIMKLKENVRIMFKAKGMGSLALLELIDSLQRLGIDYLFQKEIQASLDTIAADDNSVERLNATALRFRLLRQHGYQISQEVFIAFKDATGSFDASLSKDIKGLLSLYEASYLAVEGESILDEAKAFAIQHLKNIKSPIAPILAKQVIHSLELPLYWRISRLDARWYIEGGFSGEYDTNPDILELARLDFNVVQAIHQNDLKDMSKWWRDIGLGSHAQLSFARDRLMENFLWTIGVNFNPQLSCFRKGATKVNALITTIDDVYDVYGTLEELEFFTDAVERWDINAIEKLPNYMKICFLALYNSVNEIAYETLREQGWDIIHYLKKSWADLCKTYLVEAKWYYNKYTPTLEEYLNNAWISIAGPVILVHAYFLLKQETNNNVFKWLEVYPDIVRSSSMILRLCDDLGTSTAEIERGDVPKSIQCYMNETGCSEETAREHIRNLISKTWKKMNTYLTDDSVRSKAFAETAVNLARMAQCMYQYGDGHGIQDQETKGRVLSLIVEPITLARHEAAN